MLRKRARELETNIAGYLESKEQTGLKYNGKAIILEQKEKFSTKIERINKMILSYSLEL